MNHVLGHQYGVASAPRFHATFGDAEACRKLVQCLINILNGNAEFLGVVDFFESLGEVLANHEDHLAETGTLGIKNGIIEDGFVVWTHTVHLLQGTISGTHSSG